MSSSKVPVCPIRFQSTSNLHDRFFFFFGKVSNVKFHETPPSKSRVVLCGRTDRHDEAISRFSQLRTGLQAGITVVVVFLSSFWSSAGEEGDKNFLLMLIINVECPLASEIYI